MRDYNKEIKNAENIFELVDLINEAREKEFQIDEKLMTELPTFGSIDIPDTDGIFSWDDMYFMFQDNTGYFILVEIVDYLDEEEYQQFLQNNKWRV